MLVNSFCIYVTNLANPINRLTIVYDERHPPFLLQRLSERMAVQWRRSRNCGFQGTHWVIYSLVGSPGRDGSQPQGTTPTSTYLTQSGTPQICAPESDYFTGAYFRSSKAVTLDSPPLPFLMRERKSPEPGLQAALEMQRFSDLKGVHLREVSPGFPWTFKEI